MKINIQTAIIFTVLGLVLFTLSMVTKNHLTETLTSFALGLSFPLFISGVVAIVMYLRKTKQEVR